MDSSVPAQHGRHTKKVAEQVGADVTDVEVKNAGHGIALAMGAFGKLSMNKPETATFIHKNISKWVAD